MAAPRDVAGVDARLRSDLSANGATSTAALALDPAVTDAAPPVRSRQPMKWRRKRKILGLVSVIGGLVLWQVVAVLELINPLFFPPLTDVLDRLWELASTGELDDHVRATMTTFLIGLALAVVIGMVVGIALASSRWFDALAWPWIMAANSIPRIAVVPLVILFLGIAQTARVAVVVLTAVFPLIVNVAAGIRSVDPELLEMGRAFDAGRFARFRTITLPASVPFLLAGFRIGVAQGLIGVVVAEFFASKEGLGFLLFRASSLFDVPTIYAMMILLGLCGVILSEMARKLESHFEQWRT